MFRADPLRFGKLGRLFTASRAKSCSTTGHSPPSPATTTTTTKQEKKGQKDRRQTRIYTRKGGSEQRAKEAHLDDFLVREGGERGRGGGAGSSTLIASPRLASAERAGGRLHWSRRLFPRGLARFGGVSPTAGAANGRTFRPLLRGRSVRVNSWSAAQPARFKVGCRPMTPSLPRRKIPTPARIAIVTADWFGDVWGWLPWL